MTASLPIFLAPFFIYVMMGFAANDLVELHDPCADTTPFVYYTLLVHVLHVVLGLLFALSAYLIVKIGERCCWRSLLRFMLRIGILEYGTPTADNDAATQEELQSVVDQLPRRTFEARFAQNDVTAALDRDRVVVVIDGDGPDGAPTPVSTAASPEEASFSTTCAVCLLDFVNGDDLRALPCRHDFHTACVDPWLLQRGRCPVCRRMPVPGRLPAEDIVAADHSAELVDVRQSRRQ
jgi:hypothetical protein